VRLAPSAFDGLRELGKAHLESFSEAPDGHPPRTGLASFDTSETRDRQISCECDVFLSESPLFTQLFEDIREGLVDGFAHAINMS
jgi:hypothetical protein